MRGFSEATLVKARKMIGEEKVTQDRVHPVTWWVRSASVDDAYRVQSDFDSVTGEVTWCSCTCAHGRNTGYGTAHCWHVAAVLMLLRGEAVAGVGSSA